MVIILLLLLAFFSFLLIKSADLTVASIKKLSRQTKAGIFAFSAIILALGTSFPEIFVSLTSALEGAGTLPLAIVVGSNIANVSLVTGVSALVTGSVKIQGSFLKRDVGIAFFAGVIPLVLVLDGILSRVDGLILIAVYGVYATSLFKKRFVEVAEGVNTEDFIYMFIRRFQIGGTAKARQYGRLFIGLSILLLSADMIVRIAKVMAITMNINVFVVGLIILAVGTSLPELAFSFRSLEDDTPSMFFGNILGSTIVNSTLVVGFAAVINPVIINDVGSVFVPVISFVIVFIVFWIFIRSKRTLVRWEALVLLSLYIAFAIFAFAYKNGY